MTSITQTPSYRVAFSMYVALGGDKTRIFDSVEDIYAEIDKFYGKGSRITTEELTLEITENTSQLYDDDTITGYKPVSIKVNVAQKYTDEDVEDLKEISRQDGYRDGYELGVQDGYAQGESDGYNDGYAEGVDDGIEDQKALLEEITIVDNGIYEKEDGYKKVTVEVPIPEIPVFETETLSVELTENGTYNYTPIKDGYSSVEVTVDVDTSGGGSKPKIYNGFQFTGGDIAKVDFSQYDWSGVYDTSYFFENCSHSTGDWSNFLKNYNGKILIGNSMFDYCTSLTSIPQLDTSNMLTAENMFKRCNNLTSIPQLNTSKVTNMYGMFDYCTSLTSVPKLDTSNVTDMRYMFEYCSKLTSIPQFDTSNVTDMSYMFKNCDKLTSIPQLDTSNVTNMSSMFDSCGSLTSIPQLDTSNVTNMSSMFQSCSKLNSVPQLDTSNVTNMSSMFNICSNLTTIPKLYCGKISSGSYINIFLSNNMPDVNDLGGFEDLGKVSGFSKPSYFLRNCPNLSKESVMNVINNLYDRKSAGYSVVTLPFNTNSLALLSDEEKAIATNKGWTLATS